MTERVPLLLDVDTGIDDAAAIALAWHSPETRLLSVSTVAGNTTIGNATRNTLDVLDLLGASSVEVYQGASRPLVRELVTASYAHGDNGVGGAALERSQRLPGVYRGPASIVHHAHTRPGEITLVCVAPLTNLAIALNVEPDLPRLLRRVVVMGGAYWTPGNVRPRKNAEFNLYVDPEAAGQVFSAGFREIYAVGLDVTHEAPVTDEVWELISRADSPPAAIIRALYRSRVEHPETGQSYIHDAMAVAAALDPSLITWQQGRVEIQTDDAHRGQSLVIPGGDVHIAKAVDALAFMRRFYDRLGIDQQRTGS